MEGSWLHGWLFYTAFHEKKDENDVGTVFKLEILWKMVVDIKREYFLINWLNLL